MSNIIRIVYEDDKGRRCTSFRPIGDLVATKLLQVTFHLNDDPKIEKILFDRLYNTQDQQEEENNERKETKKRDVE